MTVKKAYRTVRCICYKQYRRWGGRGPFPFPRGSLYPIRGHTTLKSQRQGKIYRISTCEQPSYLENAFSRSKLPGSLMIVLVEKVSSHSNPKGRKHDVSLFELFSRSKPTCLSFRSSDFHAASYSFYSKLMWMVGTEQRLRGIWY